MLSQGEEISPWLVRNPGELLDQKTVRSHILRVDDARKIILVCAAGQASELAMFIDTPQPKGMGILHSQIQLAVAFHYPGIECIAAADVVVGGAGYNTVYECASVGVPLVALPLPRLYDRQQKRVSRGYGVKNIPEVLTTVKKLLDPREPANKPPVPAYTNGAIAAVQHIINYELF